VCGLKAGDFVHTFGDAHLLTEPSLVPTYH